MNEFPHALAPYELNGRTLRNRIFMGAHGTNYQHAGAPTQQYVDYLAARAAGGVGLIITEGTHVHPTSGGPRMIDMWRPTSREPLARLADGVHQHDGKVFCQLMHMGRQHEPVMTGRPGVSSSPLRDPAHAFAAHQLSRTEIAELVTAFADSAQVARDTGFDGVELHCGHGYLIEQFLSPWANTRTDEYGGSRENRIRFARELVEAVLDRVGADIVVGIRVNAFEGVPGGLGRAECLDITAELASLGTHYVSVTAGHHSSPLLVVPPAGIPTLPFLDEVAAVRRAVDCAVFASHRVRHIADAEAVLAAGTADMVNMTRAHIADPEVVAKAAQGRVEATRPCIGCVQGCRGQLMAGMPVGCLVNPRAGREGEYAVRPHREPRQVAVVGGGIAGMQFAATAAEAGHEVTLFERSQQLGGAFRDAAQFPGRTELAEFTSYLEGEVARAGVTVKLGHLAQPEEMLDFDEVVVATGAQRPGVDADEWREVTGRVIGLAEAMEAGALPGERVVVVDRGDHHNIALLLCERFLGQGARDVTVLDLAGPVAGRLDVLNRYAMTQQLAGRPVRMASHVKDLRLDGSVALFTHEGWPQRIEGIDLVVVLEPAQGTDLEGWRAIRGHVRLLGDADAPGLAVEVVHASFLAAREL
jgi:2,4-dienoyl-CoA reductase-like NADH-dependent reductase (Old Yellow Enzyme family)